MHCVARLRAWALRNALLLGIIWGSTGLAALLVRIGVCCMRPPFLAEEHSLPVQASPLGCGMRYPARKLQSSMQVCAFVIVTIMRLTVFRKCPPRDVCMPDRHKQYNDRPFVSRGSTTFIGQAVTPIT